MQNPFVRLCRDDNARALSTFESALRWAFVQLRFDRRARLRKRQRQDLATIAAGLPW